MWSCLKENALSILSWLIATYFVWAFHLQVGFPPIVPLTLTGTTYLTLFIFFLILPFAQRLKFGKFIEFEAKVEQVRADVKEVRTETRELISTISAVANSISASVNQQNFVINNNVPSIEEAQAARQDLSEVLPHPTEQTGQEEDFHEVSSAEDSDVHYALARLRMDLERELRRILGKRLSTDDPAKMQGRFLSARSLFRRLVSNVERYKHMQSSYDYVLEVCNAAIHGQRIPENVANEAIDMGLRILRELNKE